MAGVHVEGMPMLKWLAYLFWSLIGLLESMFHHHYSLDNDSDDILVGRIFWGVCVEGRLASTEVQEGGNAKLVGPYSTTLYLTIWNVCCCYCYLLNNDNDNILVGTIFWGVYVEGTGPRCLCGGNWPGRKCRRMAMPSWLAYQ